MHSLFFWKRMSCVCPNLICFLYLYSLQNKQKVSGWRLPRRFLFLSLWRALCIIQKSTLHFLGNQCYTNKKIESTKRTIDGKNNTVKQICAFNDCAQKTNAIDAIGGNSSDLFSSLIYEIRLFSLCSASVIEKRWISLHWLDWCRRRCVHRKKNIKINCQWVMKNKTGNRPLKYDGSNYPDEGCSQKLREQGNRRRYPLFYFSCFRVDGRTSLSINQLVFGTCD